MDMKGLSEVPPATEEQKSAFIEEITPIVLQKIEEHGYQPEVARAIVAQMCLESEYGTNDLCVPKNSDYPPAYNCASIKHGGKNVWQGMTYDALSGEVVPTDDNIFVGDNQQYWRAYDSYEDCIEDYFDFIEYHKEDFIDMDQVTDPELYCKKIRDFTGNDKEAYEAGLKSRMNDSFFIECFNKSVDSYNDGEYKFLSVDNTVSVDYQFVTNYVNSIISLIGSSSIICSDAVGIATSGSATFKAANEVFNSYANKSVEFLNSLGITCGNIITMADSLSKLDNALANAAMNEMTGIDLSSFNEFYDGIPNIDFLAGYRGEDGTLKITKDNLISAMSESNVIISSLINDISDTQKLKAELDAFISESKGNLQGDAWDKMRNIVGEYSDTCQRKIDYCNNLMESMQIAYRKLLNHMEEFDELDMSKMGEIIQGISDMTTQIETLTALINSTPDFEDIYGLDENGRTVKIGTKDNRALKASWDNMRNVCKEIKERLEKNLLKLEQLPGVDAEAANEILQAKTEEPDSPESTPIATPSIDSISFGDLDTNLVNDTPSNDSTSSNQEISVDNPVVEDSVTIDNSSDNIIDNENE